VARQRWWPAMLLVLGFATAAASDVATQTAEPLAHDRPLSRLRATDPHLLAVLQDALPRSPTLERLVDAIEQSDGLVYLLEGACPEHTRACLLLSLQYAGRNRVLRIRIPPGKRDADAAGSIGHELQHAVEVLSDRRVKTTNDMFALFQRIGLDPPASWLQKRTNGRFETAAAQVAGQQVRDELARTSR
jgi:hypothetical protein